ncbi:membrane protein [Coprinopsis marcescibilis]|uniref:Membrane protein n=1 Tax=Coprinopsis marcescibilis TaxID=230819 RepID=A0A5C3KSW0_COPMA|nr:membrane protein [Coprinopsis marcescibilis]
MVQADSDGEKDLATVTQDASPRIQEKGHAGSYRKDFGFLVVPENVQYNLDKPAHFGIWMNIAFGMGSMFTAANLYYCLPLLIQLSESFDASYADVSRIPALVQAGYAVGLLFITPLGDLVRRRQLVLLLVTASTTLTIGLAITSNLAVFEAVTFLVGLLSVTPQILLPFAADLAPEEKRGSAIAVIFAGLLFGILTARLLAGVIAEFASWRVVYYVAIGAQTFVLFGSYLVLPDYPSKNDHLNYWQILWSMAKFSVTEPLLVQACIINFASSACFSNFWVTLTFLLGGPPYEYSTLVIGLFGLIGMAGVAIAPLFGRAVDRFENWYATLFSIVIGLVFFAVQTGAAGIHIAAVVVTAFGFDVSRQSLQVSLSMAIFSISPEARSRMNAVFILVFFLGQVMGTSVGTKVFVEYGWRANAAMNLGFMGVQLLVLLLRGPHCRQYMWFGYEGGLAWRRPVAQASSTEAGDRAGTRTLESRPGNA